MRLLGYPWSVVFAEDLFTDQQLEGSVRGYFVTPPGAIVETFCLRVSNYVSGGMNILVLAGFEDFEVQFTARGALQFPIIAFSGILLVRQMVWGNVIAGQPNPRGNSYSMNPLRWQVNVTTLAPPTQLTYELLCATIAVSDDVVPE